jgi:hypothetical protein
MKTPILALVIVLAVPAAAQQPARKLPMRDAATHDQIVEAGRQAAEADKAKAPVFKPLTPEELEHQKKKEPRSLLGSSDILCFGGRATLVPKRAMIHVPKSLTGRIGMQEGVKIVTFVDFLADNRAWITTTPVTRRQAEGKEPLSESLIKSFEKESRIVVATLLEGPISVLPPKVVIETPTASTP